MALTVEQIREQEARARRAGQAPNLDGPAPPEPLMYIGGNFAGIEAGQTPVWDGSKWVAGDAAASGPSENLQGLQLIEPDGIEVTDQGALVDFSFVGVNYGDDEDPDVDATFQFAITGADVLVGALEWDPEGEISPKGFVGQLDGAEEGNDAIPMVTAPGTTAVLYRLVGSARFPGEVRAGRQVRAGKYVQADQYVAATQQLKAGTWLELGDIDAGELDAMDETAHALYFEGGVLKFTPDGGATVFTVDLTPDP